MFDDIMDAFATGLSLLSLKSTPVASKPSSFKEQVRRAQPQKASNAFFLGSLCAGGCGPLFDVDVGWLDIDFALKVSVVILLLNSLLLLLVLGTALVVVTLLVC